MSRNWIKAVSEGNSPVPQQEEFGSDEPTLLADVCRLLKERFDRQLKVTKSHFDKVDKLADKLRATKQHLAGLEQDPRRPRLAMEADVSSDTKNHKRMKDAVAVQAMHGENCSANQVDPDPMCLTSFGDDSTGPLALPSSMDDTLVDNGAAVVSLTLGDARTNSYW